MIMYTPPATAQSIHSFELMQWAREAARARGVPLSHHAPRSMKRRDLFTPDLAASTWAAVERRDPVLRLPATKRSYWHPSPYPRQLCIRWANSTVELATIDPQTDRVTNTWPISALVDVLVDGATVYVALPGSWRASRTVRRFCSLFLQPGGCPRDSHAPSSRAATGSTWRCTWRPTGRRWLSWRTVRRAAAPNSRTHDEYTLHTPRIRCRRHDESRCPPARRGLGAALPRHGATC